LSLECVDALEVGLYVTVGSEISPETGTECVHTRIFNSINYSTLSGSV